MVTFADIMFTSDALEVFESPSRIATVCGISRQAVGQWGDLVPPLSAAKLAAASEGKLTFDPDVYDEWNNRPRQSA